MRKETLVRYRDLEYGLKQEGLFDVIRLTKEEFEEKAKTLPVRVFDNLYKPRLYLQITGRCNLKCKHCFSAADNQSLKIEYSLQDLKKLFKEAYDTGVCGVTLTGGEPTVHPDLIEILRSIKENELSLLAFNTNGFVLKDEVLDEIKALGLDPNFMISLDGIGCHDEFRGVKGSEEKALDAMRRCVARRFRVYAQTQVNRQTIGTIPKLLDVVEPLGLYGVRLIKTSNSPRWEENSHGDDFTFSEYFDEMYKIIEYQRAQKHKTFLLMWQLGCVNPMNLENSYFSDEIVRQYGDDSKCICPAYHVQTAIAADGKVYPCLQMQGYMDRIGKSFGNVKTDGLRAVINSGSNYEIESLTYDERMEHNKECQECEYRKVCRGGCPCMGILFSGGDIQGRDETCCQFFKNGYYEKFSKLFYQ